jgi:hypothetical protein
MDDSDPFSRSETRAEATDEIPESIAAAILAAAAELPGVSVRTSAGQHELTVRSRVVATITGRVAEFALDPAVVAAALRTPDTRPAGPPDRIAFEPRLMDRYAADRAVAWLLSAVRRAGQSPR